MHALLMGLLLGLAIVLGAPAATATCAITLEAPDFTDPHSVQSWAERKADQVGRCV